MITTKTLLNQAVNTVYHIYRGNTSNDFHLILGGGPSTNNKKYIESFSLIDSNTNYILVEYSFDLTKGFDIDWLLTDISQITQNNMMRIKSIIGFSFGSYLAIQLANKVFPFVENIIVSGFLYKFEQLEKAWLSVSDIDFFTKQDRDLYLMGVNEESKKYYTFNLQDEKLQNYFERSRYFESNSGIILSSRLKDKKYLFCSSQKDKLCPLSNIHEFIKEVFKEGDSIKGEIVEKDIQHSLSGFIPEIIDFIK